MGTSAPQRRSFIAQVLGAFGLLVPAVSASATAASAGTLTSRGSAFGRRFVTGVDASGRSTIVDVGDIPASAQWHGSGSDAFDFWVVPELPAPLREAANPPEAWTPVNRAPRGGVVGRLITWAPGFQYPMHSTPTLDFIVVLSGQLESILENGTQRLGPGDVLVQRGTVHGWRNPGSEPCTFVAVLVDAARS